MVTIERINPIYFGYPQRKERQEKGMDQGGTVIFSIPEQDLIAALWQRWVRRRGYLASALFWGCIGLVLLLGGKLFYSGAAVLLLYASTRPFVLRQALVRAVKQHPSQLEPRTLKFDIGGISVSGSDWETRRGWRHFKGWAADERFIYLDLTESGLGVLIPQASLSAAQRALLLEHLKAIPTPRSSRRSASR
jgi:hypothetical protein